MDIKRIATIRVYLLISISIIELWKYWLLLWNINYLFLEKYIYKFKSNIDIQVSSLKLQNILTVSNINYIIY